MARRRLGVPHVIAYWWKSPSIARWAASSSAFGGGKLGMPWARFTPPSWSTTRVISRMTDSVKPWTRFEITRRTISGDDYITLEGIDLHPAVPEPLDPAFERALVALELERHPAVVGRHVGAADVDHDVEVLHEAIDDGLLDERRRKGQANARAGHCRHLDQRPPAIAG